LPRLDPPGAADQFIQPPEDVDHSFYCRGRTIGSIRIWLRAKIDRAVERAMALLRQRTAIVLRE
jgi:hypothetical protein